MYNQASIVHLHANAVLALLGTYLILFLNGLIFLHLQKLDFPSAEFAGIYLKINWPEAEGVEIISVTHYI